MRGLAGLAALSAFTFGAATSAAAKPLPYWPDPLDAATVRALDWSTIEASPFWAAARAPVPQEQTEEDDPYRNVKVAIVERNGLFLEGELQIARNGSGRHVVRISRLFAPAGECQKLRARLSRLYGPPAAERVEGSTWPLGPAGPRDDEAQWTGVGTTTISLNCRWAPIGHGGVNIFHYWIELEPAADAPPLAPIFGLRCDGLDVNSAPVLAIDIRRQSASQPSGVVGRGRISETEIDLKLKDGRRLRIDRATGAYTLASDAGADVGHGVCSKVDRPS
jgi:hypothetical protein